MGAVESVEAGCPQHQENEFDPEPAHSPSSLAGRCTGEGTAVSPLLICSKNTAAALLGIRHNQRHWNFFQVHKLLRSLLCKRGNQFRGEIQ